MNKFVNKLVSHGRNEAHKSAKEKRPFGFLFRAFLRPLSLAVLFVYCPGCANAYPATELERIINNLGGIDINGLPKLSFEIVDRHDGGELGALGFNFKLMHRASLAQGRAARTEWSLPCLQTCAYTDAQGEVTWLTTSGQTVRFHKKGDGYESGNNSAIVKVALETNVIEIITRDLVRWRYRNGFLESIASRGGNYAVVADRGTILSITKKAQDHETALLKCAYSKQGDLEEMEFPNGRKYHLRWSAAHLLSAIDGPGGRRFDFEYTDSLLTCWTKANSPRNELKWQYYPGNVRETAFQTPPVLLREDASHVYSWDKGGSVDTVKVSDKAGAVLSKTKIGEAGIVQITPEEEITHGFKRSP